MISIDWVEIPAGEIMVGLSKEQGKLIAKSMVEDNTFEPRDFKRLEVITNERRRKRYLPTYHISRHPVTIAQYRLFVEQAASMWHDKLDCDPRGRSRYQQFFESDPDLNALCPWNCAVLFCKWIGGVRLPTSDEWEKAIRGVDGRLFPWGDAHSISDSVYSPYGVLNGGKYGSLEWTSTVYASDALSDTVVVRCAPPNIASSRSLYEYRMTNQFLYHSPIRYRVNDSMEPDWPEVGFRLVKVATV